MTTQESRASDSLRVFISSTLNDLQPERQAVKEAIRELYLAPVIVEGEALPDTPREACLSRVRDSDIYIGIFWQRYGTITDRGISATEEEYQQAKESGKPILIYVKEPAEQEVMLTRFLRDLQKWESGHVRYTFDSLEELKERVKQDVMREVGGLVKKGRYTPPMIETGQTVRDNATLTRDVEKKLESIRKQLEIQRRNLRRLEEQRAAHGPDVPFKLLNDIAYVEQEIQRLDEELHSDNL